ncbi:hypothetical protein C356_02870 [Cryptococcus neoformans c45]|nr:hypothetical protein C356_02870 [Cryptococcus neoformans var. grubii c45]
MSANTTRRSSTSAYSRDWKTSVQREGGTGNMAHHYSHDESGRKESGGTYIPSRPARKKGFFKKLFGCTCFEFDEDSDPVARYRPRYDAVYARSPPEPIPPYSRTDPHPPPRPHPAADRSVASLDSSSSLPAQDQSHMLFGPVIPRPEDETQKTYPVPNGSFAGGTTGGAGAGGAC